MKKSVLEPFWRPVWNAVDKARVRKARQEAKAGAVVHVELVRGEIWAQVRASGPRRSCQVALPLLAHYEEHIEAVAKWLAMRPDWMAAHFAGEWDPEYVAFLKSNRLDVLPDDSVVDKLRWGAKCTCDDSDPLCVHVLTALLHLIWEADEHPLRVFRFVGLDEELLLDAAHGWTARWVRSTKADSRGAGATDPTTDPIEQVTDAVSAWNVAIWLKGAGTNPVGRLVPHFRTGDRME
ncbi:hypothetical protein SAMN04489725_10361 [Alicyclobacillus hesperidum]|uniref:SWIM-type domain-containing protein n=1 Tax=Alicyclobacillus hesperidum TaxID=89784 RepID=A0A1H2RMV7_9BACL|nr:hypothetical protein [Alicyclobacillus hesperidum]SDW20588.1 hypothetical protein SAMN04489725_10361 [Alicyclobacillus hesperidum]